MLKGGLTVYYVNVHILTIVPPPGEGKSSPGKGDHRIPPQVSYQQMKDYIRIFNEVFNA
jgi:hypothetical protein